MDKQLLQVIQDFTGKTVTVSHEHESMSELFRRVMDLDELSTVDREGKENKESNDLESQNSRLRNAHDALKDVHDELKLLFGNLKEVFFTVAVEYEDGKPKHIPKQTSPGCLKVYGYPQKDFLTNPNLWYELILEEDRPLVDRNFPYLFKGNLFHDQHRIRHKNGAIRWVETRITPTMDAGGKLVRYDGITTDITHKMLAEQKLLQSMNMMTEAQRISNFGTWELELENLDELATNEIFWSDQVFRIFGHIPRVQSASNDLFFKSVHPDDKARIQRTIINAIKTGERFSIEHRIIRPDGTIRWVREDAGVIFDDNTGLVCKMIGTVHDITERKETELALKSTEANLRNLFENTDTAYVLLDIHAEIISFNNLAFHLSKEVLTGDLEPGLNYLDLLPEHRRGEVAICITEVLTNIVPLSYEINYTLETGEEKWLHVRLQPILNDEQDLLGLSVAARNITDRIKSDKALKESNERYELATRATNDIIWDWDILHDKMYRSANYNEVFGLSHGEGDPRNEVWMQFMHEEDRERVIKKIDDILADPEVLFWEDEYRQYKRNGELAYVQDRGLIVRDEKKKAVRMVGAMRDITQAKVASAEKEKITTDLIRQNANLEQFAYIVSHNLRAPAANIIGCSELLLDGTLSSEDHHELLEGLSVAAKRLDGVINDLNLVLQVKQNVYDSREYVDFGKLVRDISQSIKHLLSAEKVKIITDFESIEGFNTIRSYLYSIFYNLILNSIKYRREDETPVIEIRSTLTWEKLVIIFRDNGMGFDLDKYGNQVFGLYKRFHHNVEGRGMGLFMVKTQVETLGGEISLNSTINWGTEFKIEFNLEKT